MRWSLWLVLAASVLTPCSGAFAQQPVYRWKDQSGGNHFSDRPPPASCTTADCHALIDIEAKRAATAKQENEEKAAKAREAEEKAAAKHRELVAWVAASMAHAKVRVSEYRTGGKVFSFSGFKEDVQLIALNEGWQGVAKALGSPDRQQQTGGSGQDQYNYWYYQFGNSTVQLVWVDRATGGGFYGLDSVKLDSVNLY